MTSHDIVLVNSGPQVNCTTIIGPNKNSYQRIQNTKIPSLLAEFAIQTYPKTILSMPEWISIQVTL